MSEPTTVVETAEANSNKTSMGVWIAAVVLFLVVLLLAFSIYWVLAQEKSLATAFTNGGIFLDYPDTLFVASGQLTTKSTSVGTLPAGFSSTGVAGTWTLTSKTARSSTTPQTDFYLTMDFSLQMTCTGSLTTASVYNITVYPQQMTAITDLGLAFSALAPGTVGNSSSAGFGSGVATTVIDATLGNALNLTNAGTTGIAYTPTVGFGLVFVSAIVPLTATTKSKS